MEFIFVIIVIAAAAAYTIRSLYRKASGGKKSCGGADGCPISEKCNPDSGQSVVDQPEEKTAR